MLWYVSVVNHLLHIYVYYYQKFYIHPYCTIANATLTYQRKSEKDLVGTTTVKNISLTIYLKHDSTLLLSKRYTLMSCDSKTFFLLYYNLVMTTNCNIQQSKLTELVYLIELINKTFKHIFRNVIISWGGGCVCLRGRGALYHKFQKSYYCLWFISHDKNEIILNISESIIACYKKYLCCNFHFYHHIISISLIFTCVIIEYVSEVMWIYQCYISFLF